MECLARGVKRAKWEPRDFLGAKEIPADVGWCMRTDDCRLSLWRCSKRVGTLEDVALALSLSSGKDRLDKLDVVAVPSSELADAGYKVDPSPGKTLVPDMENRHVDVIKLTIDDLPRLARVFAPHVCGPDCRRFSRQEMLRLVTEAVKNSRVALDDLPDKIKKEIDQAIESGR